MSLTKVEFRPASGSALEVNTVDGSGNHLYPLHEFEPEPELPDTSFKRMQAPGVWPTFAYPGAMTIVMTGEILGLGASDSAMSIDAMTKRQTLTDAVMPSLTTTLTSRPHGTLRVRYDHWSQDGEVDYHCVLCRIPLRALSPGRFQYFINLKGFTPYFLGLDATTVLLP